MSDPFVCHGTDSDYHPDTLSSSDSVVDTSSSSKQNIVKTRKRKRNYKKWQRVQSKRHRNFGEQYKDSAGRIIPSKFMKSGCSTKCRLACHDRVPHHIRLKIFNYYYKLGNKERQWDFIANAVRVIDKKVTKISVGESRRKSSRLYHLNDPDEKGILTRVCLKMFLDTLAISNQVVDTALAKTVDGGIDNRGRYVRPVNEVKSATTTHVMQHVASFPVVESHYLRSQTTRQYLDSDLSVSKMYRLYLASIQENNNINIENVTERQYRDIFNYNFNLEFFKPKKDQCNDCTMYQNMNPSDKNKSIVIIQKHEEMKKEARRLKNIDKASAIVNQNIISCCFDFQKILQCPFGNTSIFFYKRNLNLHNFTVYNLANHQGHCYLWDETTARQGASEVSSCLYKFILEEKSKTNANKFIFWTDNCPGQNKNKILFTFYSWASKQLKIDICHKFLEKGHTQNEGDSMHSTIEKSRKNKTIYIPAQYYSLIRNAKVRGTSYSVHEVEQKDIFDFKKLSESNYFTKNTELQPFVISKIREIFISKDEPHKLYYKYEFDEDFKQIILYCDRTPASKRRGRKRKQICRDTVPNLYNEREPISDAKYADLMYLCEHNFIPGVYKQFFESLPHCNINQDNDD